MADNPSQPIDVNVVRAAVAPIRGSLDRLAIVARAELARNERGRTGRRRPPRRDPSGSRRGSARK